ncbi:carboxypeptidase-like regulatory domain-containing protein [Burkholderia sp. PU8-34]
MKKIKIVAERALQIGTLVLAASTLAACGEGGSDGSSGGSSTPQSATISGTAATGAPMANASITIACKSGNSAGTANANGAYSLTFVLTGPCAITGTNGTTTLHSFASGGGTFNVTPLTELLLIYLAAELGTDLNGLLTGLASNSTYQSALTNSSTIAAAQNGVAGVLKTKYGITLSTNAFLTTAFTPGQPGQDADLDTLKSKGVVTSNGQLSASVTSDVASAGTAARQPTGGTGGSGGSGGSGAPA